ncbi:MAG: hypothetical protein MMC23_005019 [Stictis urceolatum]|nr:hypothetical protein [Stictis urceolata]
MASDPPSKPSLPLIDISPFLHSNPSNPTTHPTTLALHSALSIYGFFYLTHHSLPEPLTDRVLSLARTFFTSASPEQKAAIKRRDPGDGHGDGARGYQRIGENVSAGHRDWHEAIDWYRPFETHEKSGPDHPANGSTNGSHEKGPPYALLEGPNLWPGEPADFKAVYEEYVQSCKALGKSVLRAMGYALRLKDPESFAHAVEDSFWVMRAIGYPPLDEGLAKTGGVSCGEHSDYGCLTLLLDDGTPDALQVFLREEGEGEGEWVSVQPVEGALVVNVGDMVEMWTGGQVRSTKHRVVHTGKGFRVSVPFFLEPGRDVVVRCLDEFKEGLEERLERGEVGPEMTKEVRYWDHLVGKIGGNFYGGED